MEWPVAGGRLPGGYGVVSGQWLVAGCRRIVEWSVASGWWSVARKGFEWESWSGARMELLMDHPQALAVNMSVDLCGT
jgi:hypothetical protein